MKLLLAAILIALGAAATLLALDPRADALCAAERLRDAVAKTHRGWQCLHYAAARGDTDAVRAALGAGISRNLRTRRGQTPLILAAEHGRLDVVRLLIAYKAELEAHDERNGFTALHWAADRYHPAIARALIAAGAEADADNKWRQTPLWQASWQTNQGNTEIAHILVAAGADIHTADSKGNTPLLMAARAGHTPMIRYLLELGADMDARNDQGRTPLFQAVTGAHPAAVRLLLDRGADPNTKAADVAPLQSALDRKQQDIAALLRANGARGYERYAARAALARGRQAYINGDYDDAVRSFDAAIALQPNSSQAYFRRGLALMARDSQAKAEIDLRHALQLDDRNDEAREALAKLYVARKSYHDAIHTLDALLRNQPNNARAIYLLGESRHGLGDTTEASTRFSRACTLGFKPACTR